jgi:hypothetical protein
MRLIGVLLVLVACHDPAGSVTPPTDSQVPPGQDVPTAQTLGVFVNWDIRPTLPAQVSGQMTINEVLLQVSHLQLVSDAGADESTTRSTYQLHWAAGMGPPKDTFPDAPVALYQKMLLYIGPPSFQSSAYQISGTWRDGGSNPEKPFLITDQNGFMSSINCNMMLPAGSSITTGIQVDLRGVFDNIDLDKVPSKDGVITLEGGPQLTTIRMRLQKSFDLAGGNTSGGGGGGSSPGT